MVLAWVTLLLLLSTVTRHFLVDFNIDKRGQGGRGGGDFSSILTVLLSFCRLRGFQAHPGVSVPFCH